MAQKYDASGSPSVDYYMSQAAIIRSKVLAGLVVSAAAWLKRHMNVKRTQSLQELFGY